MVYTVTSEDRAKVEALASVGTPQKMIAKVVGISQTTLCKYYQDVLDCAQAMKNYQVANCLFLNATEKMNVTAQLFWLKCRANWKEQEVEIDNEDKLERIEIQVVKRNDEVG